MGLLKIWNNIYTNKIKFCTQPITKYCITLNEDLRENFIDNKLKPRHHPGINHSKVITVPECITNAIIKSVGDYPIKALCTEGLALNRYLKARHIPMEQRDLMKKQKEIEKALFSDMGHDLDSLDKHSLNELRKLNGDKIKRLLQRRIYAWEPINYNAYKSLQYAIGRSAQEYSVILRIFMEIQRRDTPFKPNSFFDFGSGIGTGIWAASQLWHSSLYEYFLVDSSREMNDLSELILRDGVDNKNIKLKNVYYRQFLPASNTKYDIVLCSYSLFELENATKRLDVLLNLWNKCDGYLVIIEHGTRAGFSLCNEARDFILNVSKEKNEAFVFSPCPHETECPRYSADDGTPCNFASYYQPLPVYSASETEIELYSYVVIKKGTRTQDDGSQWPRLVRPTLIRSKHTICRMCTMDGNLQEIIFTKSKHGKFQYKCAKVSKWGDQLPIIINELLPK